jgi:hypothetical protein
MTVAIPLLAGIVILFAALCPDAFAADPWMEPSDAAAAINRSDEYAWRLFVALNWPANVTTKTADESKKLGVNGPVVWETWKNAPEVYKGDGSDPGAWLDHPPVILRQLSDMDTVPLQQRIRQQRRGQRSGITPLFDPNTAGTSANETRLNREAFEFIRTNELYNLQGQLKLVSSKQTTISFPQQAKEIKAQWRRIDVADKARYHWAEIKRSDGAVVTFGLTALHITTKDLPNWFWATFEHVENPNLPGNEPWNLASRDRLACDRPPFDCNRAPKGIGLEGTKWEHYRLRGSQVDFVDGRGNITFLANSQPEAGFQKTSSCITCHARSTIGIVGGEPARLEIFNEDQSFYGAPRPEWYRFKDQAGNQVEFTQLDFVWSLFRANPRQNQ